VSDSEPSQPECATIRLGFAARTSLVIAAAAVLTGGALLAWLVQYHGPDASAANLQLLRNPSPLAGAAGAIAAGRTYQTALIPTATCIRLFWMALALVAAFPLLAFACSGMRPALPARGGGIAKAREDTAGMAVRMLTSIAIVLDGAGEPDRPEEWAGDMEAPDSLALPLTWQLRHAAGRVRAAILIRAESGLIRAKSYLAPHLDAILRSRRRSLMILGIIFSIPVTMITYRAGIYGLITNAGSLAVIGGVLYGALRGLRRLRGIKEPSGDSNRDRQDT
jgi:hypothetical protein